MGKSLNLIDLQRRRESPVRSVIMSAKVNRIARAAAQEGHVPAGNRFHRRVEAKLMRRAK